MAEEVHEAADFEAASAWSPKWKLGVSWAALLAGGWVVCSRISRDTPTLVIWLPVTVAMVLGAVYQKSQRGTLAKRAATAMGGPTTLYVDGDGVAINTEKRRSVWTWAAFSHCVERARNFYLYTAPQTFLVVPKRAFDDAALTEVRALLTTHVAKDPAPVRPIRSQLLLWVILLTALISLWLLSRS